jgi:hypothetical protein
MPGLICIFWHIFIVNHINNKFPKHQEFVDLLWCSKLCFSPISYICPYKMLSLYLSFLWKILWKNKICTVKIFHIININRILVIIFMLLEKRLFVLFILKLFHTTSIWLSFHCPIINLKFDFGGITGFQKHKAQNEKIQSTCIFKECNH